MSSYELRDRYLNEPAFNRVVNLIEQLINSETELTALDIRDACFLARVIHEEKNVRPIILSERFSWSQSGGRKL